MRLWPGVRRSRARGPARAQRGDATSPRFGRWGALLAVAALVSLAVAPAAAELAIRKPAPAWSGKAVLGDDIIDLSSEKLKGKWVVLFFYPLDFTFVCPTEIVEFNKKYAEFKKLGAEVVGVSVDSHHTHLAWTRTPREDGGVGKLDFPLLADLSKDISRKFNVLVENKDDEHYGVTMRGTYIIDPQGVLRTFSINDEPIGMLHVCTSLSRARAHTHSHTPRMHALACAHIESIFCAGQAAASTRRFASSRPRSLQRPTRGKVAQRTGRRVMTQSRPTARVRSSSSRAGASSQVGGVEAAYVYLATTIVYSRGCDQTAACNFLTASCGQAALRHVCRSIRLRARPSQCGLTLLPRGMEGAKAWGRRQSTPRM